jgi:hypothetical protein
MIKMFKADKPKTIISEPGLLFESSFNGFNVKATWVKIRLPPAFGQRLFSDEY